ncbi:MAG: type II toxin-antitoxin system ParD family antitoxin [Rhizomicrobium sp.]
MPISVDLGKRLESTVAKLVARGRYNSKSEVLREGVRLVEEREKALAELDRKLEEGLADIRAGRVEPAETVFAELRARFPKRVARSTK